MVLGYRREEEDETATEEETKPPRGNVLTSIARARRRVTDGALPPLKSVGLPPIKQAVLPTVPDTEDVLEEHEITDVLQIPSESSENGITQESKANDEEDNAAQAKEKDSFPPQKKGGRLARFFGSLGKKKTSSVVETFVITEEAEEDETPEVNNVGSYPLEKDTHLESIEDRLNEAGLENKRDVVEAFTDNDVGSSSSKGKPGHKQSRTCAIL